MLGRRHEKKIFHFEDIFERELDRKSKGRKPWRELREVKETNAKSNQ